MNSMPLVEEGVLVHDSNCWALVRLNDATNGANPYIGDLMTVDTLDIDNPSRQLGDNTDVCASNTAIRSPIYQGLRG